MNYPESPVTSAEQAATAMKALARATRTFEDPADTHWTVGNLLSIAGSFIEVLENLAHAHRASIEAAHDDAGRHAAGLAFCLTAADDLHKAALAHADAYRRLDEAASASSRIAWHTDPPITHGVDHAPTATITPMRPYRPNVTADATGPMP
ncbi:hypothetical protein ET495_08275 [Xylanimonas allomyrinae]|uniref:Uncharacterized protein n=1 Tax=Xylanimonas allomyrinae TaxID=2509459 RepID=A0A4P6EKL4_9MICO|nr:hypothetical protein [Xylanimonas allomyrinae]QAY63240.1 hypothetical protein ET495_08275 [Xylanimonas allomyrinae]